MSTHDHSDPQNVETPVEQTEPSTTTQPEAVDSRINSRSSSAVALPNRLWWAARLMSQPLLFFVAGAALLGLLGVAQRTGWITAGGASHGGRAVPAADVDFICPMMCTPPQKEQGRCPVCAMELVPASTSSGGDERSIVVDPASRRVANITTVSVHSVPLMRTIRAIGELQYDESTLRTISAYSDGRFDRLYVDFTGAVVKKGDRLATFYSPALYSAQVEYLQAAKSARSQTSKSLTSVANANRSLQENSRQRLTELGMSESQLEALDRDDAAHSRMDIVAPMSGTVIEKLAVEGEYVKAGEPVFRLADLSSVWLMLELFPEDAASVHYGQAVEATLKSLPGRTFTGRVAFIDPDVDRKSRTVSVRVSISNDAGVLRVGDYAKAQIKVPMGQSVGEQQLVYDPELANKWISPRHPHITSDQPGKCPLSGLDLIAASSLGFTDKPQPTGMATFIKRNAVLMAADHCVVYVETEPGRFEIRRVVTGAVSGDNMVIIKGLAEGETVATTGNFLLDSQMQLAGNPSLIDPTRAAPPMDMFPGFDATMLAAIQELPEDDQPLAIDQVICPVTDFKLGSMGVPPKVMVDGQPVFLCCEGCRESLLEDPQTHLQRLRNYRKNCGVSPSSADDDEMPFPPIGAIQAIFADDSHPPIEQIQPISPVIENTPASSAKAAIRSGSGRVER